MSSTVVLPGLIDCHVHFREPGYPEKATMATEAAAARAGGVLTVIDMPNTYPPTVTVEALEDKIARADRITNIDIRFFFGATNMQHIEELRVAWSREDLRRRLVGVKIYFDHSTGDLRADRDAIEAVFKFSAELHIPIVGHCEDPEINAAAAAKVDVATAAIFMHSQMRPPESEEKSITDAIELVKRYGAHFHIAHLSTRQGLDLVRRAKADGLPVTCEACPHHLFLTTDDYVTLGTLGKMNPPLRSREHRDALWDGIADATIDCIASDHAPHTLQEKSVTPPLSTPGGVTGIRTTLPLLLTTAFGQWPHPSSSRPNTQRFQHSTIQSLCFANPNRIFHLNASPKSRITVDLDEEWEIHGSEEYSKCGWTPYEGWRVRGRITDFR